MTDAVDRFAAEVDRLHEWMLNGTDQAEYAAREALLRLTRLYLAALELPPAWSEGLVDKTDSERLGNQEHPAIGAVCRRLPFDRYSEVFDPLPVPPEEPVVGSLSDDIADIYLDAIAGLREYEAGRRSEAVWEWGFRLQIHWGEHATSAIRALHCWLAANAFERLSAVSEND